MTVPLAAPAHPAPPHRTAPAAPRRPAHPRTAAPTGARPRATTASAPSATTATTAPERPRYGVRRNDRTERPAREGGYRQTERPSGGRPYRPAGERNERPSTERPTYERGVRAERPSYDRPERPNYDRGERPARPAYNRDDRPARTERPAYGDRAPRTDRPAYDRTERPARTERPSYDRATVRLAPSVPPTRRPSGAPVVRPRRASRSPVLRPSVVRSRDRAVTSTTVRRSRDARTFEDRRRDSSFYPNRDEKPVFAEDVVLERLEAAVVTAAEDVEGVTFADLGLGGNITRELESQGATTPFPIQAATIPDVLAGRDVLGRGRTGSGKTIAFGAPLVERLMEDNGGRKRAMARSPRALILAPTRELALQIDRTVQPIARSVGLFTTQVYGGVPQARQVGALRRGVDIIIGTPGRIEDLVEQGHLDLSQVTITVLDEADHMCDLGFLEPVQRILNETKEGGQKLLFSATLDKGVATLVKEFLVEPLGARGRR